MTGSMGGGRGSEFRKKVSRLFSRRHYYMAARTRDSNIDSSSKWECCLVLITSRLIDTKCKYKF